MTFKKTWLSDEDKGLIGRHIDALLWVELCKHKSLIARGRQQEHEANPSKFPQHEIKSHEYALLHWMTYAWEKCDLLGLDDQNEILNTIREQIGFERSQSNDEDPNGEPLLQETQEGVHDESLEGTPYDDIERIKNASLQHEQYDKDHDLLSNLINDNIVIHYDFWSSYVLPLCDSS